MKKILFCVGFAISINANARTMNIQEKYDLGNGRVFFVDPRDLGSNTQTVDFMEAQCNHIESTDNNSTIHTYTLTLVPCYRTELQGVIATPVVGDMVADNFESIVNFNLNSKGSTRVTKEHLYRVEHSSTLVVGQIELDGATFDGTTEAFQRADGFRKQLDFLKNKCESLKRSTITNAFSGDQMKADLIIKSLSPSGSQPALAENKGKCDITSYAGKVVIGEQQ